MNTELKEALDYWADGWDHDILTYDGFDEAIVGVTAHQPSRNPVVVYDYGKCIDILMKRDGMSYEEAVEFFEFNTTGAWMGEGTPIVLIKKEDMEVF